MTWTWWGSAWAADPIVFEGDEARALERVERATRIPAADLEPVPVQQLLDRPPSVGDGGTLAACSGAPVTADQLRLAAQSATSALTFDDRAKAASELQRVADADRCAAWDAEALRGYFVARALTDDDAAWGFAHARVLDPPLAWDEAWPADRRPAYDAAAPVGIVHLTVPQPGFRVDGRAADGVVEVPPGWHRLSGPGFDGAVELEADAVFVAPSAVPPAAFSDLATPEARAVPAAVLSAAFGDGHRVFVANRQGLWSAAAGRVDWLALGREQAHPLVGAGAATSVLGGVALAATGVWTLIASDQARAAARAVDAGTVPGELGDYPAKRTAFLAARAGAIGSGAVGGVGLVLLGVGLQLPTRTVEAR